jgi:cytoskeletal protein CcmA (bactofilin family)
LPLRAGLGIVRASTIGAAKESDKQMKPAEGSTVIGRSVTIHGELSGKEDLYMDGVVEGTISLPESRLTVGPNARVLADIEARDVVIFGVVEGNIRATGRIELRESGVMKGDLIAGRLSIEENASIKGKVELSEAAASAGLRVNAETPVTAAAVSTKA